MASQQQVTEQNNVLEKILGSSKKLQEFHSDWNKLLESDDEDDDDMESSLADDFSSTLRCSDNVDDLMDSVVTGNLEQCGSQSEKLPVLCEEPEEITSTDDIALTEDDAEDRSDSGLYLCSSSSSRLDENTLTSSQFTAGTNSDDLAQENQFQPKTEPELAEALEPVNTGVYFYSNHVYTEQQKTYVAPVPVASTAHKRNYDDFRSRPRQSDDALFRKPTFSPRLSRSSSRSSIRSNSTTSEPPMKRNKPPVEYETDKQVIERRQKQIDYGKNTIGYQTYLRKVPKTGRIRDNPVTPDKFIKYSRRSWDQQVKIWRRKIHEYDPVDDAVIHYQSSAVKSEEDSAGSSHLREVKKHLNFDQLESSNKKAPSKKSNNYQVAEDEVPFDEIDVSDILDIEDFAL